MCPWIAPGNFGSVPCFFGFLVAGREMCSNLEKYQCSITEVLGRVPEALYVYNTWQFSDYSKYESSIFSEADKRRQQEEHFPLDCQVAYDLGVRLAEQARHG